MRFAIFMAKKLCTHNKKRDLLRLYEIKGLVEKLGGIFRVKPMPGMID